LTVALPTPADAPVTTTTSAFFVMNPPLHIQLPTACSRHADRAARFGRAGGRARGYARPRMNNAIDADLIAQAAREIASADALIIGAGAGMGVDSGLPDFRGDQGFWRAYPVYEKLGLSFSSMANPRWFRTDPEMAWGFYGHRLGL